MADDELSIPLGQKPNKKRWRPRLPVAAPHAIAGVLGLLLIAWTTWAVLGNDPLGGEPMAVVSTGAMPGKSSARTMPTVASQEHGPRSYDGPGGPPRTSGPAAMPESPPIAPGTKTVTIIDGSTGKRQEVPIPSTRDVRAPVEQRLLHQDDVFQVVGHRPGDSPALPG